MESRSSLGHRAVASLSSTSRKRAWYRKPLFFVETLADLKKEVGEGRTPEQVVGNLAEKAPTGGHPCALDAC